jgi:hypothetical protein
MRKMSPEFIKRQMISSLQHADPMRRDVAEDVLARINKHTKVMALCLRCSRDCKVLSAAHLLEFKCFASMPLLLRKK